MSEQEKKRQRIYDLLNAENKPKKKKKKKKFRNNSSFLVYCTRSKEKIFAEKEFLKKNGEWRIKQKKTKQKNKKAL